MRYYKTVKSDINYQNAEKEMEKMNSQYPDTFVLHRLSHQTVDYVTYTIATFSWNDDEDKPGYGYVTFPSV